MTEPAARRVTTEEEMLKEEEKICLSIMFLLTMVTHFPSYRQPLHIEEGIVKKGMKEKEPMVYVYVY